MHMTHTCYLKGQGAWPEATEGVAEGGKERHTEKGASGPGIPKQWPFKQELIRELDEKKRLILEAEATKKAERKRARVCYIDQKHYLQESSVAFYLRQLLVALNKGALSSQCSIPGGRHNVHARSLLMSHNVMRLDA